MKRCTNLFLLLVFTVFVNNSPISAEPIPTKPSAENDMVGQSSCTNVKDKQVCTNSHSKLQSEDVEKYAAALRPQKFSQPTEDEADNSAFRYFSNEVKKREVPEKTYARADEVLLGRNLKLNTTDTGKNVIDPSKGVPIIMESFFPNGTLKSSISMDIPMVISKEYNLPKKNPHLFVLTIEPQSKNSQDKVLSDENVEWIPKGVPRRKLGNRQTGRARIMDYHVDRWITNGIPGKPGGNKTGHLSLRGLAPVERKYLKDFKQTFLSDHENFFQRQNTAVCPSLGLNPDPVSCYHYFACYVIKKDLEGSKIFWQHFSCPQMTAFSEELKFCVSPEATNCKQ